MTGTERGRSEADAALAPSAVCCDDGPAGHTQQEHHDASACFDQSCRFDHPHGGPFPHPCDDAGRPGMVLGTLCNVCRKPLTVAGCPLCVTCCEREP